MAINKAMRKKLEDRKKKLAAKGGNFDYIVFKEGTTRIRALPVGDEEPGFPVTHFYLGPNIKGVVSPATFGEPCAIMEMYEELRKGDDGDKAIAETFKPREKYLLPCIRYEDEKGKKVRDNTQPTLALLSGPQYDEVINLFLDEEYGDFTDVKTGYDIKVVRTGKTKNDTRYTFNPARPTPFPKALKNLAKEVYNPEEMVKKIVPSYEETEEFINEFMNSGKKSKKDKKNRKVRDKVSSKKPTSKKSSKKKRSLRDD